MAAGKHRRRDEQLLWEKAFGGANISLGKDGPPLSDEGDRAVATLQELQAAGRRGVWMHVPIEHRQPQRSRHVTGSPSTLPRATRRRCCAGCRMGRAPSQPSRRTSWGSAAW